MDKHHSIKPFSTLTKTRQGYFQAQVANETMKAQRRKEKLKKSTVLGVVKHCNNATHGRGNKVKQVFLCHLCWCKSAGLY